MTAATWDHSATALDFIDALDDLAHPDAVADAIEGTIARFGFDNFIITDIPGADQTFERSVLLRRWPSGWFETYAREDFVRADPVIRLCLATTSPFDWTEARYDADREPRAGEVMRRAVEFGLARGFSLPIHGLGGYETCFSISGRDPDLSRRTRPALHLMMMYAYERLRRIAVERPVRRNPLTDREREVLCWAAAGKSAGETAEIMGIVERTVNAHASAAIAKLGAANRTQAVVRAMSYGYIRV